MDESTLRDALTGLLSHCDMFGCDLTFAFPHFTSRDLRRDRFRQFPVARRFDTLWADFCLIPDYS